MKTTRTFAELEGQIALSGDLHADLQSHHTYVFHIGMGLALANMKMDEAKYALECREADLQEIVRTNAQTAGEKLTEALIAARVKSDTEYAAAHAAWLGAKRMYAEWRALESAYDSRGHSIHNLVELETKRGGGDTSGLGGYKASREVAAQSRQSVALPPPTKRDPPPVAPGKTSRVTPAR